MKRWTNTVALLLVSAAITRADIVYLRSGEKLIGKVISDEKTKVVIKSESVGRVEILRERIERIELDPAPRETPTNSPPGQPFVPAPPASNPRSPAPATNAPVVTAATNAPAKWRWFWQRKPPAAEASADWIQLKSGEWLRGKLYGMQNRKLDFESDELDDLEFDWKDVHQVVAPQALVSYGDRDSAWGWLRVDRETVTVTGEDEIKFPRYDLVGIAHGSPRELDYWTGRFNLGVNLRAGNTEQTDLVTKMKLERRTPRTHLKLEYFGNYSEVSGVESVDNQRATESFDYFLTRRLFVGVPYTEYYSDRFQNIERRVTLGGGMGYYLIDRPKTEWQIFGGPAYQRIRFETVEAGKRQEQSTPALVIQSTFETDLTKRTDLELTYQAILANQDSGGLNQHGDITFEIDLTQRLDLDISFIWDHIGHPQASSGGVLPKQDDFRLNLSLALKF